MPQCYNPKVLRGSDSTGFGRNSRFVAIANLTDSSRKRLEAIQKTDKQMIDFQMSVVARHIDAWENGLQRVQQRLKENLRRNIAYKVVAEQRSFTRNLDTERQRVLNQDYTIQAMRGDIKSTLHKMDPSYIRQQQARVKIDHARKVQHNIINRNLRRVHTSRTRRRRDLRRDVLARLKQSESGVDPVVSAELREQYPDAAWSLTPSPEPIPPLDARKLTPLLAEGPGIVSKPHFRSPRKTGEEDDAVTIVLPPVENTTESKVPEKKKTKKEKARKALKAKLAPLTGGHKDPAPEHGPSASEPKVTLQLASGKSALPAIRGASPVALGSPSPRRQLLKSKPTLVAPVEVAEEAIGKVTVDAAV